MSVFIQNLTDQYDDHQVYRHGLSMADLAEPLGFDSIWSTEHHFDGYAMCPNVAQLLTYMAGRTKSVRLGSMVAVLPWHDPIRLAEEFAVLDHVSDGRALLGIGRGLGRVEFEGFQRNMNESRERFVEYGEALLNALESGYMESAGRLYTQPRTQIRPAPFRSFKGRVYASAVSPESSRIMARLGIGMMIIAQKPWEKTVGELEIYREFYREENNGEEAPKPLLVSYIGCHEDESIADEMRKKYIKEYCKSALAHYEFNNEGLADIKGYEYYGALSRNINKHGADSFTDFLADLQIWGTPDQVFGRMMEYRGKIDCAGFIGVFSYGGMPHELATSNIETFAEAVLPRLQSVDTGDGIHGGP